MLMKVASKRSSELSMGGGMAEIETQALDQTRTFWETKTGKSVSAESAREMIANVSGFFSLLNEWNEKEKKEIG